MIYIYVNGWYKFKHQLGVYRKYRWCLECVEPGNWYYHDGDFGFKIEQDALAFMLKWD